MGTPIEQVIFECVWRCEKATEQAKHMSRTIEGVRQTWAKMSTHMEKVCGKVTDAGMAPVVAKLDEIKSNLAELKARAKAYDELMVKTKKAVIPAKQLVEETKRQRETTARTRREAEWYFEEVAGYTYRMSMGMRYIARDIMRVGYTFMTVGTFFERIYRMMIRGSEDLSAATEDLTAAWEDVFGVLGDVLAPAVEDFAYLLEWVAEVMETWPWIGKAIVAVAIILAIWFFKISAMILRLVGTILLLEHGLVDVTMRMLRAKKETVGLTGELLKLGTAVMKPIFWFERLMATLTGTQTRMEMFRESMTRTTTEIKRVATEQAKLTNYFSRQAKITDYLSGTTTKTGKEMGRMAKQIGRVGPSVKSMAKWAAKGAVGIIGLVTGGYLLMKIFEIIQPIIEALAAGLEILLEPFEPIIDMVAEWLEENEEIAGVIALMLLLLPAILGLLFLFPGLLGMITGAFGKMGGILGKVLGPLDKVTGGTKESTGGFLKYAAGIAMVVGSLALLVFALTEFLKVATASGASLNEILTLIFGLIGALLLLLAGVTASAIALGKFGSASLTVMIGIALVIGALAGLVFAFSDLCETVIAAGGDVSDITSLIGIMTGSLLALLFGVATVAVFMGKMGERVLFAAIAMLLMIGGLILLIGKWESLITTLSESGATLDEITTTIWTVTGATLALAMGMAVLGAVLSYIGPQIILGAIALVLLAVSVALFTSALSTLLGIMPTMTESFTAFLTPLLGAIAAIFLLTFAMVALAAILTALAPIILIGIVVMLGIALALWAFAQAILALKAAFRDPLIADLESLNLTLGNLSPTIEGVATSFDTSMQSMIGNIETFQTDTTSIMEGMIPDFSTWGTDMGTELSTGFQQLDVTSLMEDTVSTPAAQFKTDTLLPSMEDMGLAGVDSFGAGMLSGKLSIENVLDQVCGWISKKIMDALSGIGTAIGNFFTQTIPNAISGAIGSINNALAGVGQQVTNWASGLVQGVTDLFCIMDALTESIYAGQRGVRRALEDTTALVFEQIREMTAIGGTVIGLQRGGLVREAGLYYLHPGELVLPEAGIAQVVHMTNYINIYPREVSPRMTDLEKRELAEEISEYIEQEVRRRIR